ncbi:MAG: 3-keto-5-aminohexanoate cleavage protein [Phycisphaerae bacterium]|nr:3-keto-5-aminohexanoate cleavage protein [Phycisphaerae bacterium]
MQNQTMPVNQSFPKGSQPELAELSAGSFKLDMYDSVAQKYAFGSLVFNNSNSAFEMFLDVCLQTHVKPVVCCFEYSHLDNTVRMFKKGLIKPPVFLDFAFCGGNVTGGLTPTMENLLGFLQRIPPDLPHIWELLTFGVHEFPMALWAASLGGNIRLGLEEYHYADFGHPTTADLVKEFVPLAASVGRKPATTAETREYLGL